MKFQPVGPDDEQTLVQSLISACRRTEYGLAHTRWSTWTEDDPSVCQAAPEPRDLAAVAATSGVWEVRSVVLVNAGPGFEAWHGLSAEELEELITEN